MQELLSRHLTTFLVLIASLAVSYGLWNNAQRSAERELESEFDFHTHEIIAHIQQRMDAYQEVLFGVRALFNGSDEVTRGEFQTYVSSLRLDEHYPGIQALGHQPLVERAQKAQHIAAIRKQGFPDYTITPAGERELYTPVIYIEPFTGSNVGVLGYDTFYESTRRTAMVRAQDNDRAAASGKLTLVQETGEHAQAGFLVFLPLYKRGMPHASVAERRASISGWVTAVFRMGDLIAGLGHEHSAALGLAIYDGQTISDQTRMYGLTAAPLTPDSEGSNLKTIKLVTVADHIWTVAIQSTPVFESRFSNNAPNIVAGAALAFSLLLTMLAHALMRAKNVTRKLAESEERWRFALEGSGEGVWDWNIQTDKVNYSRRWKEMLGYSVHEINDSFSECENRIHPDDVASVINDILAHLDGKAPAYCNEHRTQHKDGSWVWILDRGMVINRAEDGSPLRMIGTHTDITERKKSETELQEQRDFTNAVVEAAGNVIVVIDLAGNFVYFNREAERLTGWRREEVLGKPVWDCVIPAEQQAAVKSVFEYLKAGKLEVAARYENDWLTRDGSRVTLDWHNTILNNGQGKTTHIVALGYDTTERKKSEVKIHRLSRLYSTLSHCDQAIVHSTSKEELFPQICLDAVKYGDFKMAWIGLTDTASGRVKPVASYGDNTEYLDYIEISVNADEPCGCGPTGTAIRENRPVWCQDFLNDPQTAPWHEYGEKYGWMSSAALPLRVNGKGIGAFNLYAGDVNAFDQDACELLEQMAADISFALDTFVHEIQRKQAEDDLNRLNDTLESIVKERTLELMQAKELADAASQAKSNFLSNMSHEIRTPLTAIIGFSEALLADDFNEQEREDLTATIVRNGKHLQKIINDILDLSKIEANQLEHEISDTSLFMVIREIDLLFSESARNKGLEFRIRHHFPLPGKILTDPTRLKQILINLCSNAIKFTDEGYVHVDVSCHDSFGKIRFDIEDSGIGMKQAEIERVFDPFAQADSTTTRKYGGTGLGLSISSMLAADLGGKLTCVSQQGQGSTFTLTIANNAEDVIVINSMEDANAHDYESHIQTKPGQLSGNILLVEDNHDNQLLITMYVRKTGAKIDIAEDGRQGVDMALANDYDMVLMDMQMPILDGLEAITLLRKQGYTRPIVSLTANAMLSTREKCIAAGANDYLVKPVDLTLFYEALGKYLSAPDGTSDSRPRSRTDFADYYKSPGYLAIVERFKQGLPEMMAELDEAVRMENWDLVQAQSHDFKGMGGAVGFDRITEVAGRLNTQVINKDYDQAALTCAELEDLCRDILQENHQE